MPMSSFLPAASVSLLNVEIIHEPLRPIAAMPDWICLSVPIALAPPDLLVRRHVSPSGPGRQYPVEGSLESRLVAVEVGAPRTFLSVASPAGAADERRTTGSGPSPRRPKPSELSPWIIDVVLSKPGWSPPYAVGVDR
jgi:hypothetical protein